MKRAPIPLAAFAVDPHGTILRWSRACEQLTGYAAKQVRGRTVESLLAFESPRHEALSILSRADTASLAKLARADGGTLPVRVTVSPEALDQAGGPTYSMVMLPVTCVYRLWPGVCCIRSVKPTLWRD